MTAPAKDKHECGLDRTFCDECQSELEAGQVGRCGTCSPILMQDQNAGRDGRRYNEWHASRPDARLNAREAAASIGMTDALQNLHDELYRAQTTRSAEVRDRAIGRARVLLSRYRNSRAQPAPVQHLKDHQIAKLVNDLRDVAKEYGQTQQLRERLSEVVRAALGDHTQ